MVSETEKNLILSKERAEEQSQLAHLELEDLLYNMNVPDPFDDMTEEDFRHPDKYILSLMMEPDYFGWTCKHLFGIDLLPMQCAVLKEMWQRPFPMLVCSRGWGKSFTLSLYCILRGLLLPGRKIVITGAGFRQSKIVFGYAEAIWATSPILRDLCGRNKNQGPHHDTDLWWMQIGDSVVKALPLGDGCISFGTNVLRQNQFSTIEVNSSSQLWGNKIFRDVSAHHDNGVKPTKKVKTSGGYSYEGTYNHKMKIVKDGGIQFVRTDEMKIGDYILIDRSYRWHNGTSFITENDAYVLGCLVGDGSYCKESVIGFATKDTEFIPKIDAFLEDNFQLKMKWCGEKDDCHYTCYKKGIVDAMCNKFGMVGRRTIEKSFPKEVLKAERNKVARFISGLYDTDGHVQVSTKQGGTSITVGFTNTSEKLVNELQFILLHFGIVSTKISRDRDKGTGKWNVSHELLITGPDAVKFHKEINFQLSRKKNILDAAIMSKVRNYGSGDYIPHIKDDMLSIAKSYKIKRGCYNDTGVSFSKISQKSNITHKLANRFLKVFGNINDSRIEKIKSLCDESIFYDKIVSIEDGETNTYDVEVPEGNEYCANGFFSHNSKIRGQRANDILADEFGSIPQHIFEEVVAGFGVVAQDPVEKVKETQRMKIAQRKGETEKLVEMAEESEQTIGNQIILSGTAGYSFNHFAKYWKKYKTIIKSQGDKNILKKAGIDPNANPKAYSVIRIPVHLLPEGFMDKDNVDRARDTINTDIYFNEYGAVFSADSAGFFKRSLIDKCTVNLNTPIILPSGEVEVFHTQMTGRTGHRYIYGVDVGASKDDCAICILEVHDDHARVVYMWTTNIGDHQKRLKNKEKISNDYFAFCVRKIRDLMKIFPCIHIAMDAQGGGKTIAEGFKDVLHMESGEVAILEIEKGNILWDGKEKPSDGLPGSHILEMVPYGQAKYSYEANHGLKNDLEHQRILFPFYDSIELVLAGKADMEEKRDSDTLEEVISEIEELKNEITIIKHDESGNGTNEKWAAPEIRDPNSNKKGRPHDDRYAAFLMANMAARRMRLAPEPVIYQSAGGYVGQQGPKIITMENENHNLYHAPARILEKIKNAGDYGTYVPRRKM